MARQADDAHVVAEVLAAKLRTDAHALRQRVHLLFQAQVSERAAAGAPAVSGHALVSNIAQENYSMARSESQAARTWLADCHSNARKRI